MNSWDKTWEKIFCNQEWGKYPPEELIRFTFRNFYRVQDRKAIKILDLGCGTGAASWYLAGEGFSTFGIDGSKTAIKIAEKRFREENLEGNFKVGDFIILNYPDGFFDAVVDIRSIQHNKLNNQKIILREIFRVLKPAGKVLSIMISRKSRFKRGEGPLSKGVFVHFFKKNEIRNLFSDFKNLIIETIERTDRGNFISYFIVSAEK